MYRILIAAAWLLGALAPVQADQLFLDDGGRLKGSIQEVSESEVVFDTDFAGTINIRRDAVVGIATDGPVLVSLDSGERLLGTLVWNAEQGQRIETDLTGTIELDEHGIAGVAMPDENAVQADARQLQARMEALKQVHQQELEAARKKGPSTAEAVWSGNVSLTATGSSGNTEEFTTTPRFNALRETEFDRLRLGAQGRFSSQDGEETENEVIGTLGLERDFSERWFAFGMLRLERDEFEDLDLRANIDLGAGYFVIQQENHEFKPQAGLGLQTEAFSSAGNEEDLVGVLGWDYRFELAERWRVTHRLNYRPTFSDPTGEYRVDSDAALVTLFRDETWGLRFQLRNEFDADPEPGIDEFDTVYSVGIQRTFK